MKRDKVTTVIYCYITTEFHYAKIKVSLAAFQHIDAKRCI